MFKCPRNSRPAQPEPEVSTTVFLLDLFIDARSSDVNSLIHQQQQQLEQQPESTGALIATNLMQLIIRQDPFCAYHLLVY